MNWYIIICITVFIFSLLFFVNLFCEARFSKELPYIQNWLHQYGYMLVKSKCDSTVELWALIDIENRNKPQYGYSSFEMYIEILNIRRTSDDAYLMDKLKSLSKESNRKVKRSKIWEN